MKKATLFMACCIGLMLFASCKKDPIAPTVTLLQGEGLLTENAQVYADDDLLVGFVATGEKLTLMETTLTQDGTLLHSYPVSINEQPSFTDSINININVTGTVTITCTVTDAAGQTASLSFNVFCEEKPNAKFIGHYEGDALFTGVMKAEIDGMDPVENEFTDNAFPVTLDLRAGETITEVTGNCKIDDQEMEIKGTVEGNTITFEAVNTTVTYNYEMNGFSIPLSMDITYTVTAVLDNETLTLDGTCSGEGELHLFVYNGTTSVNGTIGGSLVKQ